MLVAVSCKPAVPCLGRRLDLGSLFINFGTGKQDMSENESGEAGLIKRTPELITRDRLRSDFGAFGLKPGSLIMMHSSLKSVGWMPGGVQFFLEVLLDYMGPDGTLMVPTHSSQLTDPKDWKAPPVPKAWHETIRNDFPAYDPATTPTRSMGVLPETLRRWPGAIRSAHPHTSFAAIGPLAKDLTADHQLSSPMGKGSPLQRLVDLNGETLFLGTGFANNTCFHLAEDYFPNAPRAIDGAPVLVDGKRQWVSYDAVEDNDDDFVACGEAFEKTGAVHLGKIGQADCKLFRTRNAVDFAIQWLGQNR